ncbi:thiosulfate reductase cytochrome b subunit [Duganella sp. SG902]|uniref:cytochrome b/b6 domain-containing protein n=1 Tax=Duganella sp. SG902 TaxID=2587016 RepID=UPI0018242869|nr:cytochrome b/b6 domain-containing protein [Duganella sp. SG902]NVM79506.1 thiosulfate reductase cytochrome b subunit [Duganella sp. SG902]
MKRSNPRQHDMPTDADKSKPVHPAWLRCTHWLNAIAVLLLIGSGWRIYNATGFLGFKIPRDITLGGWLGGALQWHFAAMWLLIANGLLYLLVNLMSGRLRRQFFPISPRQLLRDLMAALRGKLSHADPRHYNSVQRLAYVFVMLDSALLVLSGLVLWKSVQFPLLRELLGGYEGARYVHFIAMTGLCVFIAVHVVMVALVPRTLLAMLRGR